MEEETKVLKGYRIFPKVFLSPESPLRARGITTTQQLRPETWIHPGLPSSRCPPSPSSCSVGEQAPLRGPPRTRTLSFHLPPSCLSHMASCLDCYNSVLLVFQPLALQSGYEKIVRLPCLASWDTCADLSFREIPFTSILQKKHAGILSRISSRALGSSLRSPLAHQQTEARFPEI